MTHALSVDAAAFGNPAPSLILATTPDTNASLVDWDETERFLSLLGRDAASTDALLFPPKSGPGSDKGAKKLKLDEAGRQSVEQLLSMPLYRFHSFGIRPNPGGAKAAEITEGVALFCEADGGLPVEAQEAIPSLLGLPEPTFTVWTGGKSLHMYWCAKEGMSLSREEWKKGQSRLIAAIKETVPEAGVDESIKDPSRVMRSPGGLHPATGERCRIHSQGRERYDLAALVEMLPRVKGEHFMVYAARGGAQSFFDGISDPTFLMTLNKILDDGYYHSFVDPKHQETFTFKGLRDFVTHREGLGISNWLSYMKALGAQDEGTPAKALYWRMIEIDPSLNPEGATHFAPATKEEILKALQCVPRRPGAGSGTYPTYRALLWGLIAALKETEAPNPEEEAIALMEAHSPSEECGWDVEQVGRSGGEEINAGTFWHITKENGYRRKSSSMESMDRGFATADNPSRFTAGVSGVSGVSGVERKSVRTLSVQERMELMRDAVANLLQDGTTPLDRLPVLRERSSELDLPLRDGELSKLVWEARRALTAPAEALSTGDLLDFTPIPWCWEGLLMREAVNLLIAAPKVGKTSLLIAAIAAWNKGKTFLGKQFFGECPPVLIVGSDQPQSDWGRMLQKEGLVSEERRILAPIVGLFHSGTPLSLDPEGIEKIAAYAKEHHGLLVVIDSYSRCVSSLGLSERDAEIAGPLADLQEAIACYGATIVVIHHANKGGHESASMASRGSSALPALASQLIHLTRLEQGQEGSMGGKRMLTTEGRGGAPEKMLLELSEEGQWLFRGDGDALLQEQERQKTVGSLNDRQASALEHVEETWEESEGRIGLSATVLASLMELRGADPSRVARRLLEQLRERGLVRRKIINLGMGAGGLSTQYVPTTADTFASTPDTPDTPVVKREEVSDRSKTLSTESMDVSEFQSVEAFREGQWRNGWIVEKSTKTMAGTYFTVFRQEDPSEVASLHQDFVRPCAS